MLNFLKKSILLSTLLLIFTACAPKTNGKYHTKYSYHPYYSLYSKKMSDKQVPKVKKISSKSKKEKSKLSLNDKGRFPNNISNK
jgi:hypothetical protein